VLVLRGGAEGEALLRCLRCQPAAHPLACNGGCLPVRASRRAACVSVVTVRAALAPPPPPRCSQALRTMEHARALDPCSLEGGVAHAQMLAAAGPGRRVALSSLTQALMRVDRTRPEAWMAAAHFWSSERPPSAGEGVSVERTCQLSGAWQSRAEQQLPLPFPRRCGLCTAGRAVWDFAWFWWVVVGVACCGSGESGRLAGRGADATRRGCEYAEKALSIAPHSADALYTRALMLTRKVPDMVAE
jgi:hypothetical protein